MAMESMISFWRFAIQQLTSTCTFLIVGENCSLNLPTLLMDGMELIMAARFRKTLTYIVWTINNTIILSFKSILNMEWLTSSGKQYYYTIHAIKFIWQMLIFIFIESISYSI